MQGVGEAGRCWSMVQSASYARRVSGEIQVLQLIMYWELEFC